MERLPSRIAILGTGVTGSAVARYLISRSSAGERVHVTVYDERDTERELQVAEELRGIGCQVYLGASGVHDPVDLIVASPGIPPSSALMVSAQRQGVEVISEIELAYRRSRSPWIAVTGTNGKTTVTSLISHLLSGAGVPVECVGNIGEPAIGVVEEAGPSTVIVAEVSSFQLALTFAFHPRVAVLLNITPDHVDWHGSFEVYAADKARVFANLEVRDTAVIDVDDPGSAPFADAVSEAGPSVVRVSRHDAVSCGAWLSGDSLMLATPHGAIELCTRDELRIRGDHNVSNALAAAAAASAIGVGPAAISAGLKEFAPIAHRLEPVGILDGVEYVNDSKATNPGATCMALTAFSDRSVVLMLGGRNKGAEFSSLRSCVEQCRAVVTFGEAGPEIAHALEGAAPISPAVDLREALEVSRRSAHPGDVVLLSPACASFDEFSGYAQRGDVFRSIVTGWDREEGL